MIDRYRGQTLCCIADRQTAAPTQPTRRATTTRPGDRRRDPCCCCARGFFLQ